MAASICSNTHRPQLQRSLGKGGTKEQSICSQMCRTLGRKWRRTVASPVASTCCPRHRLPGHGNLCPLPCEPTPLMAASSLREERVPTTASVTLGGTNGLRPNQRTHPTKTAKISQKHLFSPAHHSSPQASKTQPPVLALRAQKKRFPPVTRVGPMKSALLALGGRGNCEREGRRGTTAMTAVRRGRSPLRRGAGTGDEPPPCTKLGGRHPAAVFKQAKSLSSYYHFLSLNNDGKDPSRKRGTIGADRITRPTPNFLNELQIVIKNSIKMSILDSINNINSNSIAKK